MKTNNEFKPQSSETGVIETIIEVYGPARRVVDVLKKRSIFSPDAIEMLEKGKWISYNKSQTYYDFESKPKKYEVSSLIRLNNNDLLYITFYKGLSSRTLNKKSYYIPTMHGQDILDYTQIKPFLKYLEGNIDHTAYTQKRLSVYNLFDNILIELYHFLYEYVALHILNDENCEFLCTPYKPYITNNISLDEEVCNTVADRLAKKLRLTSSEVRYQKGWKGLYCNRFEDLGKIFQIRDSITKKIEEIDKEVSLAENEARKNKIKNQLELLLI